MTANQLAKKICSTIADLQLAPTSLVVSDEMIQAVEEILTEFLIKEPITELNPQTQNTLTQETLERIAERAERSLRWHHNLREYDKWCRTGNINSILTALCEALREQSVVGAPLETEPAAKTGICDSHKAACDLVPRSSCPICDLVAASEDTERMDWLEREAHWHDPLNRMTITFPMETYKLLNVREAIDAAMQRQAVDESSVSDSNAAVAPPGKQDSVSTK